jgi:hypothetical protein
MPTDLDSETLVDGAVLHAAERTVDCDLVLTGSKESPTEWIDAAQGLFLPSGGPGVRLGPRSFSLS